MPTSVRIWLNYAWTLGLVLVLGVALWFRVSSLEIIPGHDGDESFEEDPNSRPTPGNSRPRGFTVNGNLMDPFFLGLQARFN